MLFQREPSNHAHGMKWNFSPTKDRPRGELSENYMQISVNHDSRFQKGTKRNMIRLLSSMMQLRIKRNSAYVWIRIKDSVFITLLVLIMCDFSWLLIMHRRAQMCRMLRCPKCKRLLTKKDKSRYHCENPSCRVMYVERPFQRNRRVVYSAA